MASSATRRATRFVLLVAVLAVAACGGDNGGDGGNQPTSIAINAGNTQAVRYGTPVDHRAQRGGHQRGRADGRRHRDLHRHRRRRQRHAVAPPPPMRRASPRSAAGRSAPRRAPTPCGPPPAASRSTSMRRQSPARRPPSPSHRATTRHGSRGAWFPRLRRWSSPTASSPFPARTWCSRWRPAAAACRGPTRPPAATASPPSAGGASAPRQQTP